MARYTISQLKSIPASTYNLLDSDLMIASIGSSTYNLSSVRVTLRDIGDYLTSTYATQNTFTVTGPLSSQGGLSAKAAATTPIRLEGLPTSSTGLQTGELYTQTGTQLGISSPGDSVKYLLVK
tara:strand:- start:399 stop:767 length:369 start_codon:yes stop_codon:yes gene_type:complete